MLPLMVSRLPLGAGYDRCRRWGDLQAAQGQWMLDARLGGTRTLPGFPARLLGCASHGRRPRLGFLRKINPALAKQLP